MFFELMNSSVLSLKQACTNLFVKTKISPCEVLCHFLTRVWFSALSFTVCDGNFEAPLLISLCYPKYLLNLLNSFTLSLNVSGKFVNEKRRISSTQRPLFVFTFDAYSKFCNIPYVVMRVESLKRMPVVPSDYKKPKPYLAE